MSQNDNDINPWNLIKQKQELKLLKKINSIDSTQFSDLKSTPQRLAIPRPRKKIFTAVLGLFFLILFFSLGFFFLEKQNFVLYRQTIQAQTKDKVVFPKADIQILGIDTQKTVRTFPVGLKIPSIHVDAVIQQVTLNKEGAMDVPTNATDIGWYTLGPSPGERGSSVFSGHFNGANGKKGVFSNLDKLKPGDTIEVLTDLGTSMTFIVRESRTYHPGYAEEVFLPKDNGIHLNLITCDGVWDEAKKSYTKRLVVFADLAP